MRSLALCCPPSAPASLVPHPCRDPSRSPCLLPFLILGTSSKISPITSTLDLSTTEHASPPETFAFIFLQHHIFCFIYQIACCLLPITASPGIPRHSCDRSDPFRARLRPACASSAVSRRRGAISQNKAI